MEIVFEPDEELLEKLKAQESNVIDFPGVDRRQPPRNMDELNENLSQRQREMAIDVGFKYAKLMTDELKDLGFAFKDVESAYDFMGLAEVIKSMVLRTLDEEHPFQKHFENVITIDDPEEIFATFLMEEDYDYEA